MYIVYHFNAMPCKGTLPLQLGKRKEKDAKKQLRSEKFWPQLLNHMYLRLLNSGDSDQNY